MKLKNFFVLLILFSVAVSLFILVFHGTSSLSQSCPSSVSNLALRNSYSLSLPARNCNCTMLYAANAQQSQPSPPSLSCDCRESSDLWQATAGETSSKGNIKVCPDCSAPEVQIVKKEVIKEVVRKEQCPGVPWYAKGKSWHYPARFPLCSMDACFNYTRCEDSNEILVYTYYNPTPPVWYFSRINESKYHTNDPEKACIFLVALDNPSPWSPNPKDLPHWNGGMNHVLVIFADSWRLKGPAEDSIGNASIMASDIHETIYRAGFDISIPLQGLQHATEFQSVKASERKYLATFRGTRYLGLHGDGTFRSRDEFRGMHNGKDVIVATTCSHQTNDLYRNEHPDLGVHCDEDEVIFAKYSFKELMHTTFGLVPAGRQPSSYRLIEVLSAGAIPVLIADNYVKPFDTLIQWHRCLLQFPTSEMHRIIKTLRVLKEEEILMRQKNCLQFYNEFLKDDEILLNSAIRSLKARFAGAIPGLTEVRRR